MSAEKDDLKERMQSRIDAHGYYWDWWKEAAERIEALEAALRQVAERAEYGGDPIYHLLSDCRNIARAALKQD